MGTALPYEPILDVGTGNPVIILHGSFGQLSHWGTIIDDLQATHRVLVPRLPLCSEPLTYQRLQIVAEYLDEFIDAHHLTKVTLIGNSWGGYVAFFYTWRKPDRVKKLVVSGSSPWLGNHFEVTFLNDREEDHFSATHSFFCNQEGVVSTTSEKYEPRHAHTSVSLAHLLAGQHNMSDVLDAIITPTLLIWGLNDSVTPPEVALEFHNRLPYSEVVFLDACGHIPMLDQPELFGKHVKKFLQKI